MIKKRYKLPLLIMLIMFLGVNECYADGIGFEVQEYSVDSGGHNNQGNKLHDSVAGWKPSNSSSSYTYSCEYNYSIHSSNSLEVDMLDKNGNTIITKNSSGSITFSKPLTAGTAIKINITETKARWFVLTDDDVTASYTKQKSTCNNVECQRCQYYGPFYSCQTCAPGYPNCNCECTSYGTSSDTTNYGKGSSEHAECKQAAIAQLQDKINGSMSPSYTIRVQNPNYINAGIENTTAETEDKFVYEISSAVGGCWNIENGKKCTFTYLPKEICMNVKTAKVSYKANEPCGENEMKVSYTEKSGKTYWDYFSPLDSKQKSDFSFNMVRSSQAGVQPKEFCKALIEQEVGYTNFIKSANGEELSDNKNIALNTIEGNNGINEGCLLTTKISIPTIQKFYKEEKIDDGNNSKLKGFNFYYKPIDINNPFPNELGQNSLWNDWKTNKQANKENPKFSESFKSKTYEASNINPNTIRDYNAKVTNKVNEITGVYEETLENSYASWENMNVNGTSKYISDANNENGIIKRYVDNNSFYNLGCGPANKDWEGCK